MVVNFAIIAAAALIPMVLGFIWYNPKVFGTAWMKETGITEESMKGANMPYIFGMSYVFALMLGFALNGMVIHQNAVFSLFINEEGFGVAGSASQEYYDAFMAKYGMNFRSVTHGLFHGTMAGIFFIFPIFASNALFERKSAKYVMINAGYWTLTAMLMGAVICQFS